MELLDVSPTISSLARLTLRQLRQIASDLGVPLYSRKSKETLVDEVAIRQEKRGGDLKAIEAELNAPSISTTETRVVFLPRDHVHTLRRDGHDDDVVRVGRCRWLNRCSHLLRLARVQLGWSRWAAR